MSSQRYGRFSLLLLVFLVACRSQSPGEKTTASLESVQSWVATVHMASAAWNQHSVPTVYIRQTLDQAQQKIHQESKTLAKIPGSATQTNLLTQIEATIAQMAIAVEQGDRSTMTRDIEQLAAEQRAIQTLVFQSRSNL